MKSTYIMVDRIQFPVLGVLHSAVPVANVLVSASDAITNVDQISQFIKLKFLNSLNSMEYKIVEF